MIEIAPGWMLQVERGPDWLFVRLSAPKDAVEAPPLAERVWGMLEHTLTDRVVLEMDEVEILRSYLIGQLVLLHKRLCAHGGVMRLCGLSAQAQESLHAARLDGRFPNFATRGEAVRGDRPRQPR